MLPAFVIVIDDDFETKVDVTWWKSLTRQQRKLFLDGFRAGIRAFKHKAEQEVDKKQGDESEEPVGEYGSNLMQQ